MKRRAAAAALAWVAAGCARSPLGPRAERVAPLVDAARIAARVDALAAVPHRAGTPANAAVAARVADELRAIGLAVETPTFDADLPEPGAASLALGEAPPFDLGERALPKDPYSAAGAAEAPFFAWSPPGDARGRVVYANHADRDDFAVLAKAGVSVRGAVVLARAGGVCRSMKSLLAEEAGAAALLVYPERRDLGIVKPDFPDGPYLNPWAVMRGSTLRYFLAPGDPARQDARRVPNLVPRLPALPINETVAKALLSRIEGPSAPEEWTGWLKVPYRLGSTPVEARLVVRGESRRAVLRNVVATLPGRRREAAAIVVGAHTDAWVHGAVDPVSGVAAVLDVARALAALAKDGWKPERDVVFAFFDGEEYGMLGSSRWAGERLAAHAPPPAAFVYVDSSVRGSDFMGDVAPALLGGLDEALAVEKDPATGRPLLAVRGTLQLPGFSGDTAPFVGTLGVPAAQVGYGRRTYAMYHTAYDDPYLMRTHMDPGAVYGASLARLIAVWTSALADAPVPAWRFSEIADFVGRESAPLAKGDDAPRLRGALARFGAAAARWDAVGPAFRGARAEEVEPLVVAAMQAFRDPAPRDFAHGNLLLGPSLATGCGTDTLPGLRRAAAGDGSPGEEAARLATALDAAAAKLEEATRVTRP